MDMKTPITEFEFEKAKFLLTEGSEYGFVDDKLILKLPNYGVAEILFKKHCYEISSIHSDHGKVRYLIPRQDNDVFDLKFDKLNIFLEKVGSVYINDRRPQRADKIEIFLLVRDSNHPKFKKNRSHFSLTNSEHRESERTIRAKQEAKKDFTQNINFALCTTMENVFNAI